MNLIGLNDVIFLQIFLMFVSGSSFIHVNKADLNSALEDIYDKWHLFVSLLQENNFLMGQGFKSE